MADPERILLALTVNLEQLKQLFRNGVPEGTVKFIVVFRFKTWKILLVCAQISKLKRQRSGGGEDSAEHTQLRLELA
mgnify:CR=1 FL=1